MIDARRWQAFSLTEERGEHDAAARISLLTDEERRIIASMADGLNYRQIAEEMLIDKDEMAERMAVIFDKLDISDYLELVIYAYYHDLAPIPH